MYLRFNHFAAIFILLASCTPHGRPDDFTLDEKTLIYGADSIMRVLTIEDPADSAILRAPSTDLSFNALQSEEYARLSSLMTATVTHPTQDGVGIAGPQVGLNRRVVAVQRFDKEPVMNAAGKVDHPFEVYPNIRIVWASDSLAAGPEGCLSVPDRREDVMRSTEIVIEYADMNGCSERCPSESGGSWDVSRDETCDGSRNGSSCREIPMVRDTVRGFTAVIFQHEIDHLDGILYIDRL